jgi:hypothetical protein
MLRQRSVLMNIYICDQRCHTTLLMVGTVSSLLTYAKANQLRRHNGDGRTLPS